MIQELIVIFILALAVAYVGYKIYRKMHPKKTDDGCESGCNGCGTECSLKDMKKGASQHKAH